MKSIERWPYRAAEPDLPAGDYVAWIASTDDPKPDGSPGQSVCSWLIRSTDGEIEYRSPPKISRRKFSDEKRALAAGLIGVLESLEANSFVIVYAAGTYISDGVEYAEAWRERGWRRNLKEVTKNPDAWARFLQLCEERDHYIIVRPWPKGQHKSIRRAMRTKVRSARTR
ncbi:ribonuclease HI [Bradyrhizobium sp. LB8.2]|uniref:hypothetical protein n=1 Tax=Bradyrhizobium sp. LB8.2 TaxID=3156330 RepID=UPI0033914FDE